MENWVVLSLISALAFTITNILVKHLSKNIGGNTINWASYLFSLPILFISLRVQGIPHLQPKFWPLMAFLVVAEICVALLTLKSYKLSPLSQVIPFTSFTPFVVAIGGAIFLREFLSGIQILAIILFIVGAYLMNVTRGNVKDLLGPLKHIRSQRGVHLTLIMAALGGIVAPLSKLAVLSSSPEFFSVVLFVGFIITFTPFVVRERSVIENIRKNLVAFLSIGFFKGIFFVTLYMAARTGPIALVNSLFHLYILFTVLFAGLLLKEKNISKSLTAAAFMTAGAVILILT